MDAIIDLMQESRKDGLLPVSYRPNSPWSRQRSFGLKAIIALQIVQVVIGLAVFILFVVEFPQLRASLESDVTLVMLFPLLLYLVVGLLRGVAAVGLWRFQRWAWVMTMTLLALSMALDIVSYFNGQTFYFSMFVNVILVFYLNQRDVQHLFVVTQPEHLP